jgi:hypothetical protein
MGTSYFGQNSVGTVEGGLTPSSSFFHAGAAGFVCPGSGGYVPSAIEAYVKGTGTFGYVRMFLCDISFNKVAEWTDKKLINNTDFAWTSNGLTIYSPIFGGQYYVLILTNDSVSTKIGATPTTYPVINGVLVPGLDLTGGATDPVDLGSGTPSYFPVLLSMRIAYEDLSDGKIRANIQGRSQVNAQLKGVRYGAWLYQSAALNAPSTVSVTVGSTGSLTGTFSAKFTYIDKYGNESNPSPASAGVSLSSKQLNVGCPAPSDVTISEYAIYILAPSESVYKLAGTLSASTSLSTFSASMTETVIGSGIDVTETNDPIPYARYIAVFNNKLCVAGDASMSDKINVSNALFYRQFDPLDFDRVASGDGQPIKGFGKFFDSLIIGKSNSLFSGPSQGATTFYTAPQNADFGTLGQPSMVSFLKRMAYFSRDGVYGETGNIPEEISTPIRHYIRKLNPSNLVCDPPKQVSGKYSSYKSLLFAVREAATAGENDTILIYNWENGAWTKYKDIEAVSLGTINNADSFECLWGGDAFGQLYRFGQPSDVTPNADYHNGIAQAIDAWAETPWLHLPKAKGLDNWDTTLTEGAWLNLYVGGENLAGINYITMTTSVYFDMSTTVNATFSTTHSAAPWPSVTCDPKLIESFAGNYGNFQYVKFRFRNANMFEHFKIHKLVFGFRVRPIPGK